MLPEIFLRARLDCPRFLVAIANHAHRAALDLSDVFSIGHVHGYPRAAAPRAVVRRQRCRLLDHGVWNHAPIELDDDVRAGDSTRVQPPILRAALVKRDEFVLAAVAPDPDHEAILCHNAQRRALTAANTRARLAAP